MKFALLVAVTIVLAGAFAVSINAPQVGEAQQRRPVLLNTQPVVNIPAAQAAADLGESFAAIVEAVRPAVVFIRAESNGRADSRGSRSFDDFFPNQPPQRRQTGTGSGFIISQDGYIITNNHVVRDADRLTVTLLDRRQFTAELIGRDPNTDIAIIKIDATDLTAASLGNSDEVRIGEWALAIGNPLGERFSFTVTAGIVSAKGRVLQGLQQETYRIHDFIQTDAAINPGNSGGPLVNIRGQVIGVNSAIASETGRSIGYGFAVPINLARRVSEQLIATGKVTRAILGVQILDASAEDAAFVGLDSIHGVLVSDFSVPNGPGERAGLQPGDVIIALDGKHVSYVGQLQQDIGFRSPGEQVRVTVARRGGVRETLTVTLAEAESAVEQVARVDESEPTSDGKRFGDRLGIVVREITRRDLASQGLPTQNTGLRVQQIDPEGPADGYLQRGEIITHVEGTRVETEEDLAAALGAVEPGQVISVRTVAFLPDATARGRTVRFRVSRD